MFNKILIISIIFPVLFSSCGTLKGSGNKIAVDSKIRGMYVKDEEGTIIGRTPFFYQIDPGWSQYFTFFLKHGEKEIYSRSLEYQCNFNWSQSIIPNTLLIPFFPVGTIMSGTFYLVDYLSGGIYNCNNPLNFDNKLPSQIKRPYKLEENKRILIIPPYTKDQRFSNIIVKTWQEGMFNGNNPSKDVIVNFKKSSKDFNFKGINYLNDYHPHDLSKNDIYEIGHKYNATHILYFKIEKAHKFIKAKPELFDIFNLDTIETAYLKKFRLDDPREEQNILKRTLLKVVNIFPNALTLSYTERPDVKVNSTVFWAKNGEHTADRHPDSLPVVLTVFGLESVSHPMLFRSWDYDISFFPTLSISSWKSYLSDKYQEYFIELINSCLFYNVGFTFHTPLGAPGLELGVGVDYISGNDSKNNFYSEFTTIHRTNYNYMVFISKEAYLKVAYVSFYPKVGTISNQYYELKKWSEVSFSFGYYYPEMKTLVRKLLPF